MIVVCGEALIDLVDSPDGGQRGTPGGGPFTTARALARLGVPTEFLGRLSTDAFGQQLRDLLAADGADLSLTSFGPEPTTIAIADVDSDGHAAYRFIIDGTSAPNLTRPMLPASLPSGVRALHVGTLGLVFEPIAPTLAGLVEREHGNLLVMVDPNIRAAALNGAAGYRARLDGIIAESTIVKASDADMAWLYPEVELVSAARALLDHGPRLVVVTLGADGAFGVCDGTEVHVPAPGVDVVDTIGAGDAFGAGLLAWLYDRDRLNRDLRLEREDLRAALEFACLVASITCTRAGANPPRRAELHQP
ncbi:MAG TPA: carbohydrate kinase [Candidatus Dormibacteraeota bacterium]|nr:carbohydrate kinase [Candidatus Dormibacteraeota bacterium]